jgi:hypothetical protein
MQEMNCIHLTWSDYRTISNSAMLPTQISLNISPIVAKLPANSDITVVSATYHNPFEQGGEIGSKAEFFHTMQFERKGLWQKEIGLWGYL